MEKLKTFAQTTAGKITLTFVPVAAIAALGAFSAAHPTIHVVNGLDTPLTVNIKGERTALPPHSEVAVTLGSREATVDVAAADGSKVDSFTGAFSENDIVNPLGAAPLRQETWFWTKVGGQANGEKKSEIDLCGNRRVDGSKATDLLKDAPATITFSQGATGMQRVRIDFDREAPATACVAALRKRQHGQDADAIERLAR